MAQGTLYLKQYKVSEFIQTNLEAAKIYEAIGRAVFAVKSYTNAMDGNVMLENKFMEYLEQHGLSIDEINYLCLYAIGLRGKEVGEYIQIKRHYIISHEIRMKLGYAWR